MVVTPGTISRITVGSSVEVVLDDIFFATLLVFSFLIVCVVVKVGNLLERKIRDDWQLTTVVLREVVECELCWC